MLTGLSSLDAVLPMVPSEAAVLAAGVFAHAGTPNLWVIVAATALGVFAGDHLAYGLSRSVFGPRLISRSTHVSQAVAAASRQLDRRAGLLIMTSRFLPGGRVTMNAACGTARLPLSRFSPASAIAALAWAAYMAGIGFLGGTAFVENPLLGLAVGVGLSFGLGAIVELIRRRVSRRPAAPPRAPSCALPQRQRDPDHGRTPDVQESREPVAETGRQVLAGEQSPGGLRPRRVEQPCGAFRAGSARHGAAANVAHGDRGAAVVADPLDLPRVGLGHDEQFIAADDVPDRRGHRRSVAAVGDEADVPTAANFVDDAHRRSVSTGPRYDSRPGRAQRQWAGRSGCRPALRSEQVDRAQHPVDRMGDLAVSPY
jgi:membrane protein DedA with SNARE-associated domain